MTIICRPAALFFFLLLSVLGNAQLRADFSVDRSGGCSPLQVHFTNTSSGVSSRAVYDWDLGNGNHSALQHPSAVYMQEKTYTVTLTITDGGQTATQSKTLTVYQKPSVDFSVAKATICLPASAEFTATSTAGDGTISEYQWDFGDGTTQPGYGPVMSHYYSAEQVATVGLTVTNSYGCQASVVKPGMVEILPALHPSFTSDKALLCALSDTVRFTNNSTGAGVLKYLWDFGDGSSSALAEPWHRYATRADYPVRLTLSNDAGCSVTSSPVQVNAAYFRTDFASTILCREVHFAPSAYLYPSGSLWQFGDGGTSYFTYNPQHVFSAPGTYQVTLVQTYGACKDTVTKAVTVQETVNFNSDLVVPAAVCEGGTVNFTSKSSTTPTQVNWDFGDGVSYPTTYGSATHNYPQAGTYTVKMTNIFGTCSETVTKTVVVNALPKPQGFVVNYGGVCGSPVTVKLTDTTAGAVAWQWYLDNTYYGSFANTKNAQYSFAYDGYHTVYLTVTNAAGCSSSVSKPVNVFSPNATISYTYSSSPRGNYDCDSLRIRFAAVSNQTIQSYSWNLGNGSTSTAAEPEAFYDKAGVYTITLTYVTESGCRSTAQYTARVYGKPKADFVSSIPCGRSLDLQFTDISPFSDYWRWRFGDGSEGYSTPAPFHSYQDTGRYSVQLITHIGHCADTVVKSVYANVLPSSVTITKAENTCSGNRGTVTFGQQTVRASGLTWDFGDGTTQAYDTSVHQVTHAYTRSGSYSVQLRGSYNGCVLTSSVTVSVLLKQTPLLTASKTQLCASDNLSIQVSGLQTNPFAGNYQWGQYSLNKLEYNTGGAYNGYYSSYDWNYTSYAATLSGFAGGVTRMRVIINSGQPGCTDTSNYINVQVNGPVAGFSVPNDELCFKSAFAFQDTSHSVTTTPITSWTWNFGDGTTLSNTAGGTVRHTYANPGQYTVWLRVADATGCTTTFSSPVNARGTKAAFTPSGLYFPNVPLNTTVDFYNSSNSYYASPVFTWSYGDGTTETGYYGQHTYTRAGTDTIRLIARDASIACTDTVQKVVTVKDFNTAFSFSTSFLGSRSCPPVVVRINNLSVGYTKLKWDFGDGTTTTTAAYPSHIYQAPGRYRITLFTYGYNGLSGTYVDSVEIQMPSAQIRADRLQGCLLQQVGLQATANYADTYTWDFGDGTVSNGGDAASHVYTTGVFTPRLVVQDENGCPVPAENPAAIVIDSLSVRIQDLPALLCDSALIRFAPEVGSFAAGKLGTPLIYHWNFGTGTAGDTSNLANPSFRYVRPGRYVVTLAVRSPYGCSQQATATVVVQEKAKGRIDGVPEVCQDGSVQFAATASVAGPLQWSWNFGNGQVSALQNPPAQVYPVPGTYTVTLVVRNNGCADTVVHPLQVNALPVPDARPKEAVLCLGKQVALSASGGAAYQWSPAAGLSNAAVADPVASPRVTTLYRVLVTTAKGCTNTDSVRITVAQPVTVQAPAAVDLCQGKSVQLTASGAASYQWIGNVAGLDNPAVANPVAQPAATTVYTVVGADPYGCFRDTARVTVQVRNRPTVTAGPDLQIPGNVPYPLTASGSGDVVGWLWSPAEGLSCTDCPSPVLTPKMEQQYVVTVRNQWGCTASDSVLVKLDCATDHVYFPTAFTPNNDGRNDVFYVAGSGVKIVRYLRIYSRWGDLLFERSNFPISDRSTGWNGQVKGRPATPGTYVYVAELECSSGQRFTRQGTVTLIR